MIYILLSAFFFTLFSCSEFGKNTNPRNDYVRTNDCNLNYTRDISFELDSNTANVFIASQYIPAENQYSFMSIDKKIVLYDYESKQLVSKIPLPGFRPSSYEYINKDTIIVVDYANNTLNMIDCNANILNSYKINHTIEHYPFPATKISPIICIDNCIYIWGNIAGEYSNENENNRRVLLKYTPLKKEASYFVPYSSIYKENWNGTMFRWCYTDYNPNKNIFVVSFPADHFLYIYDYKSDKLIKTYGGSKYIDATKYILKNKAEFIDADRRTKHFVESHSYSKIMYDSYNDVYYRFAELQTTYEGIPGWEKNISIIILNSAHEIIGETYIGAVPSTYRYASFITKNGLHIPKHNANDDILTFSIYQLVK